MSIDTALEILKAAADPTRLRLLVLLAGGEATVGELQEILSQSQPRVSRHLRLLDEAGLVTRFRDGQWAYYRLAPSGPAADFARQAIALVSRDAVLAADADALSRVKRNRERDAYNNGQSRSWPGSNGTADRPDEAGMREALDETVRDARWGEVLDIGCGNDALLCLLGERARNVVGVATSKHMRLLARSRVHKSGLANCTVRGADLMTLPFADESFDLVVLDEVLGATGHTLNGLQEATRVLRRAGQLIIVDRIQPTVRRLPDRSAHGPLVENQLTAQLAELGMKISHRFWFPGRIMEYALFSAVPEIKQPRTGTHD